MESENDIPPLEQDNNKVEFESKDLQQYAKLFIILAVIVPFAGLFIVKILKVNFETLGPFGDFIAGSTVPFLTLASFFVVSSTILMQQHQIKLQQEQLKMQGEELRLTREEYARTNEAFEEQNKTLAIQKFENTYFKMIEKLDEAINTRMGLFTVNSTAITVKGKNFFSSFQKDMSENMKNEMKKNPIPVYKSDEDFFRKYQYNLESAFLSSMKPHGNELTPFFNRFSQALVLLNRASIFMDEWEKEFYLKALVLEIPKEALNLIMYSAALDFETDEIYECIYKFNIIDYVKSMTLTNTTDEQLFSYLMKKKFG
jgi:hypothetical protein